VFLPTVPHELHLFIFCANSNRKRTPRERMGRRAVRLALRLLPIAGLVDGLRCWGGNAVALQRGGGEARSCTAGAERFSLFRYDAGNEVCFEKCGGVTWFEGFSTGKKPFANPDGKRLCPGVVDKNECAPPPDPARARRARMPREAPDPPTTVRQVQLWGMA